MSAPFQRNLSPAARFRSRVESSQGTPAGGSLPLQEPVTTGHAENGQTRFKIVHSTLPAHDPNAQRTSNPESEAAIACFIAQDNRILEVEHHPLAAEHFSVPHWAIVYQAARSISDHGLLVSISAINGYIEENCLQEFRRSLGHGPAMPNAWRTWYELAVQESGPPISRNNILWCMDDVLRYAQNRADYQLKSELSAGVIDWEEAISRLEDIHGPNGRLPKMESAAILCASPPEIPPILIEGVLHQGSKMLIGGGSKSFKSWSLIHLSMCIASGIPWLKFKTTKSPVLYLNFELPRFAIAERLQSVANALAIPIPDNLTFWNLRGYSAEANAILPLISRAAAKKGFGFIVIDPLYKLLGSKDENLSRDMAELMNSIEHLAVEINAAVACGSHFSKGDQSLRAAIDRISGSGVFGRDPDSIVTLTQHEEADALSVEMILRNFPPQPKFVVQWEPPILSIADHLDPENLKSQVRKAPQVATDEYLDLLKPNGSTYSEWFEAAQEQFAISRPTFDRARKDLLARGKIFKSDVDGRYSPR